MFDPEYEMSGEDILNTFEEIVLKKYLFDLITIPEIKEIVDAFTYRKLDKAKTEDEIYGILLDKCSRDKAIFPTKILIVNELSKAIRFVFACESATKIWFIRNCYLDIIANNKLNVHYSEFTGFKRLIEELESRGYVARKPSDARFATLVQAYLDKNSGLFFKLCMDALLIPVALSSNDYTDIGEMIECGAFIPKLDSIRYVLIIDILKKEQKYREIKIVEKVFRRS